MRSKRRPEGAGDGLAERRLAHAGRPDEAQDGAARVRLEPQHRQELEDAVLHALDVVVVGVEHLARVREVEVVRRELVPRQRGDPLEVGPDDAVLGGGLGQLLQARQLPVDLRPHGLGEVDLGELPAQLVHLGLGGVALAELLLDRLELLAQHVLALGAVELGLDLRLDARADVHHLELAREDLRQPPQPPRHVALGQQRLLLLRLDPQGAGDQVGERRRVLQVGHRQLELLRQVRDRLDDVREGLLHVAHQGRQLGPFRDDVGQLGDGARRDTAAPPPSARAARAGPTGRGSAACRRAPSACARPCRSRPRRRAGPGAGDSCSGSRLATMASIRSPPSTSLTSRIERSWPTASGVSVPGKATESRSGSTRQPRRELRTAQRSPPRPPASGVAISITRLPLPALDRHRARRRPAPRAAARRSGSRPCRSPWRRRPPRRRRAR